jgi:hypothetical protein
MKTFLPVLDTKAVVAIPAASVLLVFAARPAQSVCSPNDVKYE